METQQLSLIAHLKRGIWLHRFLIVSILLVSIGFTFVLYSHLAPSTGIPENLSKDIGVALFTSGIIGLALEYYTRKQFLEDMAATMSNVIKTSPLDSKIDLLRDQVESSLGLLHSQMDSKLDVLSDQISLGNDLSSLGVRQIYRDRTAINLLRYLEEAEPGSEIKLLGISMMAFTNVQAQLIIDKKLREGCKLKLLTLDPKSEAARQRATEEERDYEDVMADMKAANGLYTNLINYRLPTDLRQNIELRHYASAPTCFILYTNNTMLVGPYLSGSRGLFCPHLELEIKQGGIYLSFLKHFEYLWDIKHGSKGVQEQVS